MEQIRRLRFSPREAAQALGISKSKLYQHINQGEISGYIINNRRWFRPSDLEQFIEQQAEMAQEKKQ
ncbi:MAG: helix-turn-helix domain-containing protein [Woeseiaceae bacterium]